MGLVVVFRKTVVFGACIELRDSKGVVLAKQGVSSSVDPEFITVHGDSDSIVVFSGESDWVWKREVWELKPK